MRGRVSPAARSDSRVGRDDQPLADVKLWQRQQQGKMSTSLQIIGIYGLQSA